jgi:hypothetical protein
MNSNLAATASAICTSQTRDEVPEGAFFSFGVKGDWRGRLTFKD